MKLTLLTAVLAVSLSSNVFAAVGDVCPKGTTHNKEANSCFVTVENPCANLADGPWYFKNKKPGVKGMENDVCIKCAGGYTWDTSSKKCVPLMH